MRGQAGAAVAVAGTATSCAAMDLGLEPYDADRVEGHRLTRALVLEAPSSGTSPVSPLAERRAVPGLHPDRAPTIVAGVAILLEVLALFGLDGAEASDRDLLWGLALAHAVAC